jgi:hypothetical protein
MATNPINQPFQPFHVQSSLLNDGPKRDNSGHQGPPQDPNDPRTPSGSGPWKPSDDPSTGCFGWLAALAFTAIYAVTQRYVQLAPLTIAILIGCVLFRLGARERQFAAVPVALAGIKLALQLAGSSSIWHVAHAAPFTSPNVPKPQELGVTWLPLFFSICLFYMPKRVSVTSKITLACSLILLVSGLLPGDGYVFLFAMVQYFLFLAIAIGLLIDFIPQHASSAVSVAGHGVRP